MEQKFKSHRKHPSWPYYFLILFFYFYFKSVNYSINYLKFLFLVFYVKNCNFNESNYFLTSSPIKKDLKVCGIRF